MENVKQKFMNDIAARLAAAAESDAKSEMIEELAENLTRRYEDMEALGVSGEEAFARAMEELGDVDELTAYLNSLEPEPSAQDSAEELLRAVEDVGRAAAEMGKKAVNKTRDFLQSDASRAAVEEGKKAVYRARDFLKKMAEQGAIAWNGRNVKLDFDDGPEERRIPGQELIRLDVELPNGDVDICLAAEGEDSVLVEGDVDDLDVYVSGEGVLTVRQRYTASGQFFSFRGISGTDVSLTIPAKRWDSLRVATACGDIDVGDGLQVQSLDICTASGDVDCRMDNCASGEIKTASGDITCRGSWQALRAETVSGDVDLRGAVGEAAVTTVSGDVGIDGAVTRARVRSMSGDIQVKSTMTPQELDLGSKSGDVDARVPDEGPFHARLDTVNGQIRYDFPREWTSASVDSGSAPRYTLASISGDVSLKKLV